MTLVLLFGVSAHASKNAFAPAQPALERAGLSPTLYAVLAASPMLGALVLPTMWGILYKDREQFVLLAVPVGQFGGQLLVASGIYLLEKPGYTTLAEVLLFIGLMVFSAFHGGAHVVQCTVLARVLPINLTFGFALAVISTHLLVALCNFIVPVLLRMGGLMLVQVSLFIPSAVSIFAGIMLARVASDDQFAITHSHTQSDLNENPLVPIKCWPRWQHCLSGMRIIWLLSIWKALIMGTTMAMRTIQNGLLVSYGFSAISAGRFIGTTQIASVVLMPVFFICTKDWTGRKFFVVVISVITWCSGVGIWYQAELPVLVWKGCFILLALSSTVVPVLGQALVPGQSKRSLGRSFGLLESLFSLIQMLTTVALGAIRQHGGGFEGALELSCFMLFAGVLTSIALACSMRADLYLPHSNRTPVTMLTPDGI